MCLSKVYEVLDGNENLISDYVSGLSVESGYIIVTDIMGEEKKISGAIKSIDLVKNVIIVSPVN